VPRTYAELTRAFPTAAPFKLSVEYITLMGEDGFKTFCSMLVRGFLAVRAYAEPIIDMCVLMAGADLGC
jgi:phosphatidylinositol kinase/protein kinase (PI-3  family)